MNVDANLLKNIVDALVTLSDNKVCTDGVNPIMELETCLIEESEQYFRKQADQNLQSCSLVEYMQLADKILQQEKRRFTDYLTWDQID